jgi:hypothetical protein
MGLTAELDVLGTATVLGLLSGIMGTDKASA